MQEILVDGRKLGLEGVTQMFEDFVVSAHRVDSTRKAMLGWRTANEKAAFLHTYACSHRTTIPDLAQLDKMIARFAPTELRADVSKLSPGDRQALVKLIEASRDSERHFSQAVVERQPGPIREAPPRYDAARQGAPALFLDQQRTLVGSR